MDKKLFRSILLLLTYAAFLLFLLMNITTIFSRAEQLLELLKPLYLGFALAFILNQPCLFFRRTYDRLGLKGYSLPLAVASSYLSLVVVLGVLFSFVIPKVAESGQLFLNSLSGYLRNLAVMLEQLLIYFNIDSEFLSTVQIPNFTTYLKNLIEGLFAGLGTTVMGVVAFTGTAFSVIVTGVMALFFSVYMLGSRDTLLPQCRRLLLAYAPPKVSAVVLDVVHLTADTFTRFIIGQLTEACILGGLCAAGMLFIQADYAPLVGVIIGVSALIPVAGAYIGAILSAFMLLMVSPVKALIFLVFLLILQQVEGNVIYPRVVGTSIGLPGIWVLAAVTIGAGLFGLAGALLSVPVASVLYALLKRDVRRRLQTRTIPSEDSPE